MVTGRVALKLLTGGEKFNKRTNSKLRGRKAMLLTNLQLKNFIYRIRLKPENMQAYRVQLENLKTSLEEKIKNDNRTGIKVTKFIIAGSWKKRTILRRSTDHPIDIDLVLYVEGDENLKNDLETLHDFVFEYLKEIYPTKDIFRDVDVAGKTKSIKIKFIGSGLEVDIVPVVPIQSPLEYVLQPQRGGGGKYITSVTGQLSFAQKIRGDNSSYTRIVRALKWWRNYKELKPDLSSYMIELIVSYLDLNFGVENNIEEGIIRFFKFVSDPGFPEIHFKQAINSIPAYSTPVFIGDPANNENNTAKALNKNSWNEIVNEANEAFETLNYAQARNFIGDTIAEWKRVFGPSFNIDEEE